MRNTILAVALAVLFAACGGGGSSPVTSTEPPVSSGPSPAEELAAKLEGLPLDEFYELSFGALISRSPETVVWQGLEAFFPLDSVGLDDLSDQYQRDTYAMAAVVLDMLGEYDREGLSDSGKRDYDVYEFYLTDFAAELEFIYHGFPASYSIFGEIGGTELFFTSAHPLNDRDDAENYITRLLAVDNKMTQLAAHLERQRVNGIVEPRITMQFSLGRVQQTADGSAATNEYFTSFRDRVRQIPGLSQAQIDDLEARALAAVDGAVRRGYQALEQKLEELVVNAPASIAALTTSAR